VGQNTQPGQKSNLQIFINKFYLKNLEIQRISKQTRRKKMAIKAYCVKCKAKEQDMTDAVISKTPKGGYMAKGKHAKCGTTMCAMMSTEKAEKAIAAKEAKKGF
jgi:hypothetical protein